MINKNTKYQNLLLWLAAGWRHICAAELVRVSAWSLSLRGALQALYVCVRVRETERQGQTEKKSVCVREKNDGQTVCVCVREDTYRQRVRELEVQTGTEGSRSQCFLLTRLLVSRAALSVSFPALRAGASHGGTERGEPAPA